MTFAVRREKYFLGADLHKNLAFFPFSDLLLFKIALFSGF